MSVRLCMQLVGFVLVLLFVAGSGGAQESHTIRTDLFPGLFEKLKNDAALQALWGSCPADIYRREAAFWTSYAGNPDIKVEECEADPVGCYDNCFQARNENACFALARAFQDNSEEKFSRYWEALFARACAVGSDGACTNRGAGIRNGLYEDDPFTAMPEGERDSCLFRTFQASCRSGDAWGCTMYGQSYQYGEGVAVDPVKAAEFYRKSCEIDPDFDACDYAKEQLAEMEGRPSTPQ
jgi:hypothetical protein